MLVCVYVKGDWMEVNNYLRLALMFGNNDANTFSTNLEKMICLVLFEKYEKGLLITEIIDELKNKYGLEFSDAEILQVVDKNKRCKFVCLDSENFRYSIKPEQYDKIKKKTEINDLKNVIDIFLLNHKEVILAPDDLFNLIIQYFYGVFNSNAETILSLMNKDKVAIKFVDINYTLLYRIRAA